MAQEMKLPELGENIESAEVVAVLVSEGDTVAPDQPVLELETDKATAEVPASLGGLVRKIHVRKGDQVRVGQVLLTLEPAAAATGAAAPPAGVSERQTEPRAASAAEPRPVEAAAAVVQEAALDEVAEASVDSDMLEQEPGVPRPPAPTSGSGGGPTSPASPAVRRLARELGLDISMVSGSGAGGRVTEDDVKSRARSLISTGVGAAPGPSGAMAAAGQTLPDFTRFGEIERQPLGSIRRRIAENMARAWSLVPQVTQSDRADVSALEEFRGRYAERVAAEGGKLTVTAVAVKLAAAALRRFPVFNASLDAARGELILKKYVNVGVAVDTDRGLLVPVIRDADRKNLMQISVELSELADKTRQRKAAVEDLQGSSFTISNLGGLGTTHFSPIVNWPEVAILGLGRSRREPVDVDGDFEARSILPLSLSYDHRVIDGADAARFLRWLAEAMESPLLALLEG